MLPNFPLAKSLYGNHLLNYLEEQKNKYLGGVFSNIPHRQIYEGDRAVLVDPDGTERETKVQKLENSSLMDMNEIADNPTKAYEFYDKLAKMIAKSEHDLITSSIHDVTKETGNVLNYSGKIDPVQFFQMIDKLEIDFDSNGNPSSMQFVGGEQAVEAYKRLMATIENDKILKKKYTHLLAKKRAEYRDRENSRKLVD